MRVELPNHLVHSPARLKQDKKAKKDYCVLIDNSIKPIGICSVLAGLGVGAAGLVPTSEYLVATGVLFYLVSWFGDWWAN